MLPHLPPSFRSSHCPAKQALLAAKFRAEYEQLAQATLVSSVHLSHTGLDEACWMWTGSTTHSASIGCVHLPTTCLCVPLQISRALVRVSEGVHPQSTVPDPSILSEPAKHTRPTWTTHFARCSDTFRYTRGFVQWGKLILSKAPHSLCWLWHVVSFSKLVPPTRDSCLP